MKTIKVIDLLNEIRNEEYVPKKIKYNGDIFKVRGNNYYSVSSNRYLFNETNILTMLNDEVEIIEDKPKEDKKIEKMDFCYKVADEMQNANNERFRNFINEIIDKVNDEDHE